MRDNGCLGSDVDLPALAAQSKNFSGAEIAGLIKSATSFALYGNVDVTSADTVAARADENVLVKMEHFEQALLEVVPAFGVAEEELEVCLRGGMIEFGHPFRRTIHAGTNYTGCVPFFCFSPICVICSSYLRGPGEDK
jgi:vesicle-fusing ATPase